MSSSRRFIIILPVLAAISAVQGFTLTTTTTPAAASSSSTTRRQTRKSLDSTTQRDPRLLQSPATALNAFAMLQQHEQADPSLTFVRDVVGSVGRQATKVPFGIRMHMINSIVGLSQLQSIATEMQSSMTDFSSNPQVHEFTLMCLAFNMMGTIYDNTINAVTRYVEPNNDVLLQLHKLRFVWHVVAMPLLGIPVTELAARAALIDETTCLAASGFFVAMAIMEGHKMITTFDVKKDLKLVDNRQSRPENSIYMLGVVSHTTTRPMELALPAVLMILYETIMGGALEFTQSPSSSMLDFTTSAPLLLACGVSTLVASGMGRKTPEIQLLSENTHMALLSAAYLATASF